MKKLRIIASLVLFLFITDLAAQDTVSSFKLKENTLMLPRVANPMKFDYSFGVIFTHVPFDWVETALQAPLFNIHATMGLPYKFSLTGDFTTLLVTNQLRIGTRWNYEINSFSFNIGIDGEYGYGRMGFAGFDSRMYAWTLYPNLSVGYLLKDVALTLQIEINDLLRVKGIVGENEEIESSSPLFNGGSLSFWAEQRYWKHHVFAVGLRLDYVKFFFPAWMAYSTFNHYYLIPQLIVSFKM